MKYSTIPLSLLLCACHESSDDASASPAPLVTNSGLAVAELTGEGELWLLSVSEAKQGGTDMNGDGDALDHVAHLLDAATGQIANLGFALQPPPFLSWRVSAGRAAFAVPEEAEGVDLNGDGDLLDVGTCLYEHASGTARSLGISNRGLPFLTDEFLGLSVYEGDEGRDLDGDGRLRNSPLLYLDLATGEFVSTNHEAFPSVSGALLLYTRNELADGDLNGDGDALDGEVAVLHDMHTRQRIDVGIATRNGGFFAEELVVLGVSEHDQGAADLNGDGDRLDLVVHVFDPSTGQLTNTGLGGSGRNGLSPGGTRVDGWSLLVTDESSGVDRNGDGDLFDLLPALYERSTGRILESGIAMTPFHVGTAAVEGSLAIAAKESEERADLNGDGDQDDLVVHVLDPRTGRLRNLRQETGFALAPNDRGWLELARFEPSDDRDWNRDGDKDDYVPVFVEARSGRLRIPALETTGPAVLELEREALLILRDPTAVAFGLQYALYDPSTDRTRRLGLYSGFESHHARVDGRRALFTVFEGTQGEDLNGDGDLADDVLHRLE